MYTTSLDYNGTSEESITFFKIVQNKIHFAAHGNTAAEIVFARADAKLPNMGLKTFSGEAVKKTDIDIAKNYLTEEELATLNRMVSAFFDLAELRAMNRQPMYMKDWIQEIDDFSERYGKGVLENAGKVSRNQAVEHASKEYRKYKE